MVLARSRLVGACLLLFVLSACGGGSGGSSDPNPGPPPTPPPSALSYPQPSPFVINQQISPLTPTVTGQVTSYTVSPTLPAGLLLNSTTGVISGTPTAVTAQATYTVTASNSGGSTTVSVKLTVNDVPPALSYASSSYGMTVGVPALISHPTTSGGAIASWSISPALPAGLQFYASDGGIAGVPTAAAAMAPYVVTATGSGGQARETLKIGIAGAPLLDVGHANGIWLLQFVGSRVLSEDYNYQWLLQDFASGSIIARGQDTGGIGRVPPELVAPDAFAFDPVHHVDLEGNVMVDEVSSGLEVRSATDGNVLATIPIAAAFYQYRLAKDGSYIVAGTPAGLVAWSTSGQQLFSRSGDYTSAYIFAAPGEVLVASGPAGANVIETVSVPSGASTVSPAFQGTFNAWFLDGQGFLTNLGTSVWTYSNTATQLNFLSLSSGPGTLGGEGNWFWANGQLYKVGSNTPVLTLAANPIPSGTTLGVLNGSSFTIIDLSGASPVSSTAYTVPLWEDLSTYAATSPNAWLIAFNNGVLVDGTSLAGTPRLLTLGAVSSIVAGTQFISVATASGQIFYYNASDDSLAGTIAFPSSMLATSADGTLLAAEAGPIDNQHNDRSIHLYSLPSGTEVGTFSYSYPQTNLQSWSLSSSGNAIGEVFASSATGICQAQVIPVAGGAPVFCGSSQFILLSPDGTLVAATGPMTGGPVNPSNTNIYRNGTLVTTVPGVAAGWIDNSRLLVNDYGPGCTTGPNGQPLCDGPIQLTGASIFDSSGNKLADTPMGIGLFQTVSSDSVYGINNNQIFSLTSGSSIWTSANTVSGPGAVTSTQVVFPSNNLVLVQPY